MFTARSGIALVLDNETSSMGLRTLLIKPPHSGLRVFTPWKLRCRSPRVFTMAVCTTEIEVVLTAIPGFIENISRL